MSTPCGAEWRRLALPRSIRHWSLTTLREKPFDVAHGPELVEGLAKPPARRSGAIRPSQPRRLLRRSRLAPREGGIGAKVIRHSRYVIFQLPKVAVPREMFAAILSRIQRLAPVST